MIYHSDEGFIHDTTLSPDGQRLAFIIGGEFDRLYTIDADGTDLRTLIGGDGPQVIRPLAWTPDSSEILFGRAESVSSPKQTSLWRIPAGGGEARQLQIDMPRAWASLNVHPDGNRIAFTDTRSRA